MATSEYANYSNNELLEIIRQLYIKLGRVPKATDINSKNNCPSLRFYYRKFSVKSLNEIFILCGIPVKNMRNYTQEEGLEKLREFFNILKKVPTQNDFSKHKWHPTHSWYNKTFGSYDNACYIAGITTNKPMSDEELIDISIKEFINIGHKLKKCPTREEYNTLRNNGMNLVTLQRKLNISLNEMCRRFLPMYKLNSIYDISNEQIINDIYNITNKIGRTPMGEELKKYGIDYSLNLFTRRFGSYNNFIKSIGLIPYQQHLMKTNEELLNDYYNLFKEIERIPSANDIKSKENMCSCKVYNSRFGSFENVCKLLDIDYTFNMRTSGTGRFVYDKNKELCRSIIERNITNFFIDNNIEYKKEVPYSELGILNNKIFDWKITIDNKIFYIEYFGLYNPKYNNNKSSIIYRYNKRTKNKIKEIYKSNNIDKCIFIFPNTIKLFEQKIQQTLNTEINNQSLYDNAINDNISDEYLLQTLMKFSDDKNYIPSHKIIVKENKLFSIYNEIRRRYGSLENFANKYDKKIKKYNKSSWDENRLFDLMIFSMNKYNKILSVSEAYDLAKTDKQFKGYENYISKIGGIINIKLKFFNYCINNKITICINEIYFLKKLSKKEFPYGKINDEQCNMAKTILNSVMQVGKAI